MKGKWKKPLIAGVLAAAIAAGGSGWYYVGHTSSDPVYVYPFDFVGMTEYWGDSRESSGPVSMDRIQTVFLSETQSVDKVLVKEGDQVKKGDVLMTFDSTLSALAVERKRLEVERLRLQLENAELRLQEINGLKPMQIVEPEEDDEEEEDVDLGDALSGEYEIYRKGGSYDGSSSAAPLIFWMQSGKTITNDLLRTMIKATASSASMPVAEGRNGEQASPAPETEEEASESRRHSWRDRFNSEEETEEETEEEEEDEEETEEEETEEDDEDKIEPFEEDFYVVFKVTEGNMSKAAKLLWQGVHISHDEQVMTFTFFDASGVEDPALTEKPKEKETESESGCHRKHRHTHACGGWGDEEEEEEEIELDSGMTASQIAQLRSQQMKKIKELEFKLKMADAEYKIMQTELGDGNIYAETDGKVISILSEDEAKDRHQPVMKVSGGGGFYVEGSVSELERDQISVGQEVTVSDWESGMSYPGTITEIRDFPNSSGFRYGMGNPNATQYPFVVFVDETADLRADTYVTVAYSASGADQGIYLQTPFVRTERGESFVYVLGENGRLEKRTVSVGKSLWGSYVEIRSGLTVEDKIAFPYGKNVRPGVKAAVGDLGNLYN